MRVALMSDIHGNLVSLEAVLADIDRQGVDQIVCLGDVATIGPQPREVVARLRALDLAGITGNHESYLLNPDLIYEDADAPPWLGEMMDWCTGQLSSADFDYLRSFHPLIEIPFDAEVSLLCFHGSPKSNSDMILATTPAAELDEMLAGHVATVMAGGHTHVQMVRQHNGVMIVNAGSVGEPLEQMPVEDATCILPWAEYTIVSWVDGLLGIESRRVPIDLEAVKGAVSTSDMPDAVKGVWSRMGDLNIF
jgi:predicted phosphodiesterase